MTAATSLTGNAPNSWMVFISVPEDDRRLLVDPELDQALQVVELQSEPRGRAFA
jgi:hypothetical protein